MQTETKYISEAVRIAERRKQTAAKLGLSPDAMMMLSLQGDFFGSDFHGMVDRGCFDQSTLLRGESLESAESRASGYIARLTADDDDPDLIDRVLFALKGQIQIGDEIEADESKTYLGGGEYLTAGKRYKITEFSDLAFGNFSITHTTNFPAPDDKHSTSSYGIKKVFRNGKLIWTFTAAFIADWDSRHPGNLYPRTKEDEALMASIGNIPVTAV